MSPNLDLLNPIKQRSAHGAKNEGNFMKDLMNTVAIDQAFIEDANFFGTSNKVTF